ncbi:hypothetical protein [Laribacter hongkongensis]|uniref:Uncharacterized protein n=1 Tax=Laribacter hongkongensis TaxID=168471 RepID=A0A248LPK2_9NEIS|nr:hypothetical protein [Laribacter hongkongensis]ASJ26236.1 hypothetical protein LHGZ1_3405 [Laribacter hongkongensis]MCG8996687.1 hypothetical protein [Laribacter hongkongensis]MCG9011903.1 hypothetical protein [Laribacter hongkongensis]MCG9031594.1 hypothetical protein [Laribacter hongkongensis]MCG9033336.1 hypothetical protein [Laribacter hongkongensis]
MAPTHRQIAAGQRRTLAAMQRKLQDMAAQWGDVDAWNESALDELATRLEEVAENLTNTD